MDYPKQMTALVEAFKSLPGVGAKSAQRYAFFVLSQDGLADRLAAALVDAKLEVGFCNQCYNIAAGPLCTVCSDPSRDRSLLAVVRSPEALVAFERSGEFSGIYHVLGGLLSPMDGVEPDALHLPQLAKRVQELGVVEVIVAVSADAEGEATADYIGRLLAPLGVRVTRPAYGLPVGGEIESVDALTLRRSLAARTQTS